MQALGEVLRIARDQVGMTLEEAAAACEARGLKAGRYQQIEQGEVGAGVPTRPPPREFEVLVTILPHLPGLLAELQEQLEALSKALAEDPARALEILGSGAATPADGAVRGR